MLMMLPFQTVWIASIEWDATPSIPLSNAIYIDYTFDAMWQHSDARDTWPLDCHLKRNETDRARTIMSLEKLDMALKFSSWKSFLFLDRRHNRKRNGQEFRWKANKQTASIFSLFHWYSMFPKKQRNQCSLWHTEAVQSTLRHEIINSLCFWAYKHTAAARRKTTMVSLCSINSSSAPGWIHDFRL